ncbi:hypothetical protein AYO40_03335 [Planctomycetaceae bacterium SCGC AG-212-D15]|nr:hypothetical protein AYO40_03335 [Planctomycetaceae bacterium SCGC AG-212-D15]
MEGFSEDWQNLGLDDDDLWVVQLAIMARPTGGPVIQGTGGLRKLRYKPPKGSGIKKAVRVCYVYFKEFSIALLVIAYAKDEMDNISTEQKKACRELIRRQAAVFAKRAIK